MTISNNTTRVEYTAGNSTVFAYDWKVFSDEDLLVIQRDTLGTETTLTLDSDYTATVGDTGGNVTVSASLNSTDDLIIILDPDRVQLLDLTANGPFPAASIEAGLDKVVNIVKRVYDLVSRSLTLTDGSTSANATYDAANGSIINLATPTVDAGAATKAYVDSQISAAEIGGNTTVSAFGQTLIDDANASVARATLGAGAVGDAIFQDTTAAAVLTELGVSAFVQTVLDDSDAATARTTLAVPDQVPLRNRILNADFQLWRPLGTTFDSGAPNDDDAYFADQWIFLTSAGSGNDTVDINDSYVDSHSFGFGSETKNSAILTVNDNSYKFGVMQILESKESLPLRGYSVTVSFYAAADSDLTGLRCHLVSWDSNFTGDTVTSDWVSAWNGATTAPTPITNVDLVTASGGSTFTATSSFLPYSFTFTVPADTVNLGVFIGTNDSSFSNSAKVGISAVQLVVGSVARPFQSRTLQEETVLCDRFYTNTFPLNTAPADELGAENAGIQVHGMDEGGGGGGASARWDFPVEMIAVPTISTYNPENATNNGNWTRTNRSYASVTSRTLLTTNATVRGVNFGADSSGTNDVLYSLDAVADARL